MTGPRGRPAWRPGARPLDWALMMVSLLCIEGALTDLIEQPEVGAAQQVSNIVEAGNVVKQIVLSGVYLCNLVFLLQRMRMSSARFVGLPVALLMGWCWLSVTWSPLPDGTVRRTAALMGSLLIGTVIGLRFNVNDLTKALCLTGAAVLGASAVWGVVNPHVAIDFDGYLRGILSHKNGLGAVAAITALATVHRMIHTSSPRIWLVGSLALCALTLGWSHSATPLVCLAASLAALLVLSAVRGGNGLFVVALPALAGCAIALFALYMDQVTLLIADALGRDATLSGRTNIWSYVLDMIARRTWTGYGFGIFWLGERAPAATFWYWTRQYELHAHDGYLQLLLDVGVVGFGLFVLSLACLLVRASRLASRVDRPLTAWVVMFLGYLLVYNVTETQLWEGNDLLTVLYVWAVVHVNLKCRAPTRSSATLSVGHPALAANVGMPP